MLKQHASLFHSESTNIPPPVGYTQFDFFFFDNFFFFLRVFHTVLIYRSACRIRHEKNGRVASAIRGGSLLSVFGADVRAHRSRQTVPDNPVQVHR